MPRSGPDDQAIVAGASVTLASTHVSASDKERLKTKYALIDIDESVLPYFNKTLLTSFAPGLRGQRSTAPAIPVGVGDTIKITIFESASGGLFIPAEGGARPGNFVQLPEQTIDKSGTITVPYVGRVRAAGYSTNAIENAIVKALSNKAIEPQAVVSVSNSRSSQVTIIGDVGASQRIDISASGERLLDVLARSGGVTSPAEETYITVTRDGQSSRVLFKNIITNPKENVYILPNDQIFVDRERRTFVAFGATGLIGRVDFSETNLNLAEAIGEVGGLNDNIADPAQVFIYRRVDRSKLENVGLDVSKLHGKMVPTVFRINFRDPSALFRAQEFAMQDRDIVYVSNADSIEILKLLGFIDSVTGAANSIVSNVNGTKTGLRALED